MSSAVRATTPRSQVVSLTKRAIHWLYDLDGQGNDTPVGRLPRIGVDLERPTPEGLREMSKTDDADALAAYVEDHLMVIAKKDGHGIGAVSSLRSVVRQARR